MTTLRFFLIAWLSAVVFACQPSAKQEQPVNELLSAEAFNQKLEQTPSAQVVDVRTPEEFATGHLANASNIDYNAADFAQQLEHLDKSKPVFVYCLSGGRSGSAAAQMQQMGFEQIYGLDKGLIAWKQADFPLETADSQPQDGGMSMEEFAKQVTRDKLVLVDFNATWCGPCKKMLPVLKKLEAENKDKLVLFPVDADENPDLLNQKQIEGIPHLELYQKGKLVWTYSGFASEEHLLESIRPHL